MNASKNIKQKQNRKKTLIYSPAYISSDITNIHWNLYYQFQIGMKTFSQLNF